jgi:hypothetical protein
MRNFKHFPHPKPVFLAKKLKRLLTVGGRETRNATLKTTGKRERLKPGRSLFARSRAVISVFFTHRKQLAAEGTFRQRKKLS